MAGTKALALGSALVVGGFLFFRFGFETNMAFGSTWGWYQGAALLAGIGLAGIFRAQWPFVAVGLWAGPFVYETAATAQHIARDSTCCNLWPIVLVAVLMFCLPAPFIGAGIGVSLMRRNWLPRVGSAGAIVTALAIGGLLPHFVEAVLHRLERQTVPQLLAQIHDAEMAYSASQPDGAFACEGKLLPGPAGKLHWYPARPPSATTFFMIGVYSVSLECLNHAEPHGFRLRAGPSYPSTRLDRFTMDQSGVLDVAHAQ